MVWKKISDAARDWAGDVHPKILYYAIRQNRLQVARIGAGRNMLTCEKWIDEWLQTSALPENGATVQRSRLDVSDTCEPGRASEVASPARDRSRLAPARA